MSIFFLQILVSLFCETFRHQSAWHGHDTNCKDAVEDAQEIRPLARKCDHAPLTMEKDPGVEKRCLDRGTVCKKQKCLCEEVFPFCEEYVLDCIVADIRKRVILHAQPCWRPIQLTNLGPPQPYMRFLGDRRNSETDSNSSKRRHQTM